MTEQIFVDTNIWVDAIDAADPDRREHALDVIAPASGRDIVVSTPVLTEFYAVVTRKLAVPVPASDASLAASAIASSRLSRRGQSVREDRLIALLSRDNQAVARLG